MRKNSVEDVLVEQMGEGIHTALRKACDSKAAHDAWTAIRDMPDGEWVGALRWAAPYILNALRVEMRKTKARRK